MRHSCPYCNQELNTFAFNCIRCSKPTGTVEVEGVMLAAWWLDADGRPAEKISVKTLKRGNSYLDVKALSFAPAASPPHVVVTLTTDVDLKQGLTDFFAQAGSPSQEWDI